MNDFCECEYHSHEKECLNKKGLTCISTIFGKRVICQECNDTHPFPEKYLSGNLLPTEGPTSTYHGTAVFIPAGQEVEEPSLKIPCTVFLLEEREEK